jgi:hypothetical protein
VMIYCPNNNNCPHHPIVFACKFFHVILRIKGGVSPPILV